MNNYNERILVVEDDKQVSSFVCFALKNEGFFAIVANTGQIALNRLVSEPVDIMLLDLGLPDIDGIDLIRKVREWSDIPIIVVSARDQDKDKISALDCGADDYLTKPFSVSELLARIRVTLRHLYRQSKLERQTAMSVGGLRIDFDKRLVYLDGALIHVTPTEYSLLTLFFKNIGKVLTTGYIIKEIWGAGYGEDTQALRAQMAGLRRRIEQSPANPRYIITEVGVGYRLVDE